MWPLLASITALQRRGIDSINHLITVWFCLYQHFRIRVLWVSNASFDAEGPDCSSWNFKLKWCLRSLQRFSIGFKSDDGGGHFITGMLFSSSSFITFGVLWHSALSCMNRGSLLLATHIVLEPSSGGVSRLLTIGNRPPQTILSYSFDSISLCSKIRIGSILLPEKHAQTMILTRPDLKLGIRYCSSNACPFGRIIHYQWGSTPTHRRHSSENITFFRSSAVQSLYWLLCFADRYGLRRLYRLTNSTSLRRWHVVSCEIRRPVRFVILHKGKSVRR